MRNPSDRIGLRFLEVEKLRLGKGIGFPAVQHCPILDPGVHRQLRGLLDNSASMFEKPD